MLSGKGISHRSFHGANGDIEHFISISGLGDGVFDEQIADLQSRYHYACNALGLTPESAVFKRVFLSDAINQAATLNASELISESDRNPVAVSVVQQPPLPAAKIALMAYHIESKTPFKKRRLSPKHMLVEKSGMRHMWSTRICCGSRAASAPEHVHTRELFGDLIDALKRQGGTLGDHCVRTWVYLKDVDVFYRGMVNTRRELFAQEGLTEKTHYIASTGIEGGCDHQFDLVSMDAYSILDLVPGQISYLNDFDHLCPTKDYNVTFERGTRVAYADRAHHFISGTASIDYLGRTVHPGDVMRQMDRALVNIDVLLKSGQASLADMMYMIVYLRDRGDFAPVEASLRDRFPGLPISIVQGAVCRPEWLIEIEGVAVASHHAPQLPSF